MGVQWPDPGSNQIQKKMKLQNYPKTASRGGNDFDGKFALVSSFHSFSPLLAHFCTSEAKKIRYHPPPLGGGKVNKTRRWGGPMLEKGCWVAGHPPGGGGGGALRLVSNALPAAHHSLEMHSGYVEAGTFRGRQLERRDNLLRQEIRLRARLIHYLYFNPTAPRYVSRRLGVGLVKGQGRSFCSSLAKTMQKETSITVVYFTLKSGTLKKSLPIKNHRIIRA